VQASVSQDAEGQQWQGCIAPVSDRNVPFELRKDQERMDAGSGEQELMASVLRRDCSEAHESVSHVLQEAKPMAVAARR
jgi:hypothetical protein